MPLVTYIIDGAVTGQFDKLQVEALKMSLGILTNKARMKEYAWRSIGLVPNYAKVDSRGKKIFRDSGHMAAQGLFEQEDADDEGAFVGPEGDIDKAADYHEILAVLLESVKELIAEGMVMDIRYRGNLHKNCELVFFMPFVKCDGDEGDKLCLSFRSRGKHVQQLCRYCKCPTNETDDVLANHPYKTESELKKLYERGDTERLRQQSQICAENAFHGIRFGLHDKRGIHGGTPWEILHAVLLGVFVRVRDCFFQQLGKTSAAAEEANALSKLLGALLDHQSERDKPRVKFMNGIHKGKLMAKEFTGVMLIMSAILRVDHGMNILKGARKKNFREDWQRKDWILLVETMLQWEAYMSLDRMQKKDVERCKKKFRFVMFLMKKVANRTKKMGFKLPKFHCIIHFPQDIINYGVPSVVDTGSNESHHKVTKVAAKLTQKDMANFEKQTSERLDDLHTLELAMQELAGFPLWHYFDGQEHESNEEKDPVSKVTGMKWKVLQKPNEAAPKLKIESRGKNVAGLKMSDELVQFCWSIQRAVAQWLRTVTFYAEQHRNNVIFRSHPNYLGKGPWRDWVMVQWDMGGQSVPYPAQIWGFVDLKDLPEDVEVDFDEITTLTSNVYAIIESGELIEEGEPLSDIWQPIILEVGELTVENTVAQRKFYMVDVEAFLEPMAVIPNIGSPDPRQYLRMSPRRTWAEDFIEWIQASHKEDNMEMELEEPEEDDSGNEDDEGEEGQDDEDEEGGNSDDDEEAGDDDEQEEED